MDLSFATIPRGIDSYVTLMNEFSMPDHVETPEHLFEEAMCSSDEIGNFMVLANYWEDIRQHPFPLNQI